MNSDSQNQIAKALAGYLHLSCGHWIHPGWVVAPVHLLQSARCPTCGRAGVVFGRWGE